MSFSQEIIQGKRFEFGKNWNSFLKTLDDKRIEVAIDSLKEMLEVEDLAGKKFLDIGSGSGLFSLAAKKLGAEVYSFDFDTDSVGCTKYLRDTYFPESNWIVEEGSVLDVDYVKSLGQFDIVYSWGVLHHTGQMYKALDNAALPVKDGGKLFIAIYNDEGAKSKVWKKLKRLYVKSTAGKYFTIMLYTPYYLLKNFLMDILYLRKPPLARYRDFKKKRGMSWKHDLVDWLGGYPFEVASIPVIFNFYKKRGFILNVVTAKKGKGCNQFVFAKGGLNK
ncbi:class I SAM-dependent methyltransferase [Roseivirga sp.]|uniref:class I SAM-dependent methyltransferase n=1 Tax=Roseivirga sp. TaxID=1964215 RepID=UPI002B26EC15|nr:class I SAM-dependent methyltransferase [Roseivirga sp.]